MPWFELKGDERIMQRCASDNCGGQPTWRLEADGVGSNYCSGCKHVIEQNDDDICGLCGEPGADKIPHPVYWPGERQPETDYVHASCENAECARAHGELSDKQRDEFLRTI